MSIIVERDDLVDVVTEALSKAWTVHAARWDIFVAELLSTYQDGLRAHATCKAMRHDLGLLSRLPMLGPDGEPVLGPDGEPVPLVQTTADLTMATIARFVRSMPAEHSPHSVRSRLRSIRIACNVAVTTGKLKVSPFAIRNLAAWVRVGKLEGKRHLSREATRAILDVLAQDVATSPPGWRAWKARRLQALVSVYAYGGLRASEGQRLHFADCDFERCLMYVRSRPDHRLKTTTSEDIVPMAPPLRRVLLDWASYRLSPPTFPPAAEVPWLIPACRGKSPWVAGTNGTKPLQCFQAVATRAGIEGATFQSLRRGLATHLRHFGASAGIASKILRHSVECDERFYHGADAANLISAVEHLEF